MALPPLLGLFLSFITVLSTTVYGQTPVVSIRTQPSEPPFKAATQIHFACDVDSNLNVTYQWTGYCTSQGGTVQRFFYAASRPPGEFSLYVKSTPTTCLDLITCTATDSTGATGRSSYQLTPNDITGVGLWGSSGPLPTNAAIMADSGGQIGSIACHSASRGTFLVHWVGPAGSDITFDFTDPFAIEFHTGPYPSYSSLELNDGESFGSNNQGVYSCAIEDENGVEHMLNIAVYPYGYSTPVTISSVRRTSEVPLTITCTTNGKPATNVKWANSSTAIIDDDTYQISQSISDRRTSSYSNTLTIEGPVEDAVGIYGCTATTEVHSPVADTRVETARHFFGLFIVGTSRNITCTIREAVTTYWIYGNDQLSSAIGSRVSLRLEINDSVHHRVYTCKGRNADLSYSGLVLSIIVYVPSTALSVSVDDSGTMVAGEEYSLHCLASKTVSGLANTPSLEWLNKEGRPVTTSGPVTVGESITLTSSVFLSLTFSSLHTSHAGQYTCRATLSSPALDTPLLKNATSDLILQIPEPATELSISSSGPVYSSGSVILTCSIQLSDTVDSPVTVASTWRKDGKSVANSAKTTISQIQQLTSALYRSTLTVSNLNQSSDEGEYSCEVTVAANPSSPYVMNSPVGSASLTLTIHQVSPFKVQVDPSSVEGQTSDTVILVCTATVHDSVIVPKTFHWSQRVAGGPSSDLTDNGGAVRITNSNLNTSTSTSQLVLVDYSPGQYQFVCSVTLQFPGEMGDILVVVVEQASVTISASKDDSGVTWLIVGAVAGGTVVILVVIILAIVFFVYCLRKQGRCIRRRPQAIQHNMRDNDAYDCVGGVHNFGENIELQRVQQHHQWGHRVAMNDKYADQFIDMNPAVASIPGLNGKDEHIYDEVK